MPNEVLFSEEKQLGIITLNRPQALNSLTLEMIIAMQQQLHAWQHNTSIHAIVIQAQPGKAFCAGGDVRWLYRMGQEHSELQQQFFWHEYRLNYFIHRFSKPYIALMDGITMGGGVGISLHGRFPIASEAFKFAMPETSIGFFPDIGASYLLSRCSGYFGEYLALTGNHLSASSAQALGLIQATVAANQFDELVAHLNETDLSINAYHHVNECIQSFAKEPCSKEIDDITLKVNRAFSKESVEAIMKALQDQNDTWSNDIYQILKQKSPLSLKVTLEQIRKARTSTLEECFAMDYCLVQHFMHDHDFYEGVRALLIDKDKSPKWQPALLDEVQKAQVNDYFVEKNMDNLALENGFV